jgi:hypothetical protein
VTGVDAGVDVDVDVGGSVDAESCVCVGFDTDDAFRTRIVAVPDAACRVTLIECVPVVTSSRTRVNSPELLVYPLISPSTATVPF